MTSWEMRLWSALSYPFELGGIFVRFAAKILLALMSQYFAAPNLSNLGSFSLVKEFPSLLQHIEFNGGNTCDQFRFLLIIKKIGNWGTRSPKSGIFSKKKKVYKHMYKIKRVCTVSKTLILISNKSYTKFLIIFCQPTMIEGSSGFLGSEVNGILSDFGSWLVHEGLKEIRPAIKAHLSYR